MRCGLKGQHIFIVCLICAISDAALITVGVMGLGEIIHNLPWLGTAALIAGVIFVTVYGLMRIRAFFNPDLSPPEAIIIPSLGKTVVITLGFTWLNPHVYLDTVFLIGTISTQFDDTLQRIIFGMSAVVASFSFFFAIGYGARALAPIFQSPARWRYVDLTIGLMMFIIAAQLGSKALFGL